MAGLVQIRGSTPSTTQAREPMGTQAPGGSERDGSPRDNATLGLGPGAPRVYMETFGCQMNEADTALVLGRLAADGWARADSPADADLILINTCAVREKA